MVRTTLGAEVETEVTVSGSESVRILNKDQTGTISSGTTEDVIVRAPTGSVFEILSGVLQVPSPGSQATGDHQFSIQTEVEFITVIRGTSSATTGIEYQSSYWTIADQSAEPNSPGDQTKAIRGVRVDDSKGLLLRYSNDTDTDQTGKRLYRLWVREITVSE